MATRKKQTNDEIEVKQINEENLEDYSSTNKSLIIETLKISGIGYLVTGLWETLESIILGHVNQNGVDTIIAIILVASLYMNLRTWENSDKE